MSSFLPFLEDVNSLKFAPEAFSNPAFYLNVPETSHLVGRYLAYLNDNGNTAENSFFKVRMKIFVLN